ncbi:Hypothetical protein D9617_5g069040 [Elsinoe fawcettii]|nr:Hypothetical protein D9617_5g069040 [Elsinoe fawcettii]
MDCICCALDFNIVDPSQLPKCFLKKYKMRKLIQQLREQMQATQVLLEHYYRWGMNQHRFAVAMLDQAHYFFTCLQRFGTIVDLSTFNANASVFLLADPEQFCPPYGRVPADLTALRRWCSGDRSLPPPLCPFPPAPGGPFDLNDTAFAGPPVPLDPDGVLYPVDSSMLLPEVFARSQLHHAMANAGAPLKTLRPLEPRQQRPRQHRERYLGPDPDVFPPLREEMATPASPCSPITWPAPATVPSPIPAASAQTEETTTSNATDGSTPSARTSDEQSKDNHEPSPKTPATAAGVEKSEAAATPTRAGNPTFRSAVGSVPTPFPPHGRDPRPRRTSSKDRNRENGVSPSISPIKDSAPLLPERSGNTPSRSTLRFIPSSLTPDGKSSTAIRRGSTEHRQDEVGTSSSMLTVPTASSRPRQTSREEESANPSSTTTTPTTSPHPRSSHPGVAVPHPKSLNLVDPKANGVRSAEGGTPSSPTSAPTRHTAPGMQGIVRGCDFIPDARGTATAATAHTSGGRATTGGGCGGGSSAALTIDKWPRGLPPSGPSAQRRVEEQTGGGVRAVRDREMRRSDGPWRPG